MEHEVGNAAEKGREKVVQVRIKGLRRAAALFVAVMALFTYGQYLIGRNLVERYREPAPAVETGVPDETEYTPWGLQDGMRDSEALAHYVEVSAKYTAMVTKALDDNMHIPIVQRMSTLYRDRMRSMVYDPTAAKQPMTTGPVSQDEGKTDLVSIIVFGQAGAEAGRGSIHYSKLRRGVMIGSVPCPEAWFQASVLRELFLAYADNADPEGKEADMVVMAAHYVTRQVLAHKTGSRYTDELEKIAEPHLSVHWNKYLGLVMTPDHIQRLDAIIGPPRTEDREARDDQYLADLVTYWSLVNGVPDPDEPGQMETAELGT